MKGCAYMKIMLDTSALMQNLSGVKSLLEGHDLLIPTTVLEELDNLKESKKQKDSYKARQAIKFINTNEEIIDFIVSDKVTTLLAIYDANKNDNKILNAALISADRLLTYDLGMRAKAKQLGITIYDLEIDNEDYKGYRYIKGNTDDINLFYDNFDNGLIKLLTNEYLIVENLDTEEITEQRFDGEKLIPLKLPDRKIIKGLNAPQRCALDILNNPEIPIKIIAGNYGSGKTMLSMKMAQKQIFDGIYNKLLLVRNPNPADDIDIGALPGDIDDKVGKYFKPMLQYLESSEDDKLDNYIETEIVSYMKGISVNDTFMIVDEAEDLNSKLIKMIGTRLGKNSVVVFCGDYKQSEKKYKEDNGLNILIEKSKGNPLVGIILLEEDVRSSASKVFANL